MTILFYGIICLVSAIIYFLYFQKRSGIKYLENIPGPPTNFLIGNALDFLFKSYEANFQQLITYVNTYGKIVRINTGPNRIMIVTADPKLAKCVLSSSKFIDKSKEYVYFKKWLGNGILTTKGAKWKTRRRIITPAFHFSILEQYIKIFNDVGDVLIRKLNEQVGQEKFNIHPILTLATLDIICEASLSTSVNALNNMEHNYTKAVKKMCEIIVGRIFSPIPDALYFLRRACYEEKAAVKIIHDYSNAAINTGIKKLEAKHINLSEEDELGIKKHSTFLDLMLQFTDENGQSFSYEDIRAEVDGFILGGHDTTATALAFTLYCIAMHSEVQQKILEEQNLILDSLDNPTIHLKELNNMHYLELVIKEALRLYPPAPYIGRQLTEDLEYEGTIYPKNASIVFLMFHMHRNAEYFPDPDKFLPERFKKAGQEPFSYIPFSAGPRICLGQKFAMLEMKSVVSKIVRNFELLPAKPKQEQILSAELVLLSKNGVWIALKHRNK